MPENDLTGELGPSAPTYAHIVRFDDQPRTSTGRSSPLSTKGTPHRTHHHPSPDPTFLSEPEDDRPLPLVHPHFLYPGFLTDDDLALPDLGDPTQERALEVGILGHIRHGGSSGRKVDLGRGRARGSPDLRPIEARVEEGVSMSGQNSGVDDETEVKEGLRAYP